MFLKLAKVSFLKDKNFTVKQCVGLTEFLKEQRSNCAVSNIWGNSEYSQTNHFSYKVNIWGQCTLEYNAHSYSLFLVRKRIKGEQK